jgi:putative ABC transport system ATP-binding protein
MTARRTLLEGLTLTKSYGEAQARTCVLRDVSCAFYAGELSLLMGPSGSGKTTLVSLLAGLMRASSGSVRLCGNDLDGLGEEALARLRRRHLGFVFQHYNLLGALTALDNVAELLVMKGEQRRAARARAEEVLFSVGLGERMHHRPKQLSGGQQQRVAIARAIAARPDVIIGDEVTAALDSVAAESVMELLRTQVAPDTAVVLVTHDPRFADYADRIVALHDGRLREDPKLHARASAP